jgi:hypothetical protein
MRSIEAEGAHVSRNQREAKECSTDLSGDREGWPWWVMVEEE